jgi:hypothetical protein
LDKSASVDVELARRLHMPEIAANAADKNSKTATPNWLALAAANLRADTSFAARVRNNAAGDPGTHHEFLIL